MLVTLLQLNLGRKGKLEEILHDYGLVRLIDLLTVDFVKKQ